jgi:hypothetical protein
MTDPYRHWDVLRRTGRMGDHVAPALQALLPPIPPPELPSHPIADGCPVPNAASDFAEKAAGYGWRVRATHARGPKVHMRLGTVTRVVDSIAIRISRGHRNAYAVWIEGTFDAPASLWLPGTPLTQLSSAELHLALRPDQEEL